MLSAAKNFTGDRHLAKVKKKDLYSEKNIYDEDEAREPHVVVKVLLGIVAAAALVALFYVMTAYLMQ